MIRIAALLGLLVGLAIAIGLFVWQGVGPVFSSFAAAGFGIVLVALSHFVTMTVNGRAWQVLLPKDHPPRPNLFIFVWAAWLREAVNSLLPVARIGGEIVTGQLLIERGVAPASAIASLIADVTIFLGVQLVFTLIGIGLLATLDHSSFGTRGLVIGALVSLPLIGLFLAVQKFGLFKLVGIVSDKLFGDRFTAFVGDPQLLDDAIRQLYQHRSRIIGCCLWQFAGLGTGALEIWLSLRVLHRPIKLVDALIIESLIQALSSTAFIVPGALGVQEGGFLVLGEMIGLTPELSLALALMRRARDLLVFVPALIGWQWSLGRKLLRRSDQTVS